MPGEREPFGAVLTAEVIAAIERRKQHLGSPTLTSAEVARHNTKNSCYIRLLDYVFDVTGFLKRHPGGELLLLQNAGDKDRAKIFASVHSAKAGKMLPDMFVATICDVRERGAESPPQPASAPCPVPAPSGAVLTALVRQDSQGSAFSESCGSLEALEAFEIGGETTQRESLGAIAEASGETQGGGSAAVSCESVEITLGLEPLQTEVDQSPLPSDDAASMDARTPECDAMGVKVTASLVSLSGDDQGKPSPEPGHDTATGQEQIGEASSRDVGYVRGVPFEPEATTSAPAQAATEPASSASRMFQAPAGGTLDAKTTRADPPGQTKAGAQSKCPFAAMLKAAGHDISAMPMPANHKGAHAADGQSRQSSPFGAMSGAGAHSREKLPWRGLMSELPSVPETRPVVGTAEIIDGVGQRTPQASAVEDEIEPASPVASPLRGVQGRRGSTEATEARGRRDSVESAGINGSSKMNLGGSSRLSGFGGQVFKFSLHDGSTHGSHSSATGSRLTGSKASGRGRAAARKRRARAARAKSNKVDMIEWNKRVATIKDFWDNLLKDMSMTGLGTSLLDTVETDETLEPLFRYSNKEVQGTKFMDMLSSIVDNINSPEMIYGKIGDLGGMHYRLGVRAMHMPIMKEALFKTLDDAASDIFTDEVKAAWTYVWDYMTVAMTQTLEDEGSTLTLVMDSWEIIAENKTARELGELLYDYLFTLVPNVRGMFTKSREEMAIKMGDALEMIISCAENPGSLQDQLRFLGLRHVTYKVHPHHIPLMGPPLLSVLAEQLGGEWTSEVEKAWTQLFNVVSETMATSIREGMDQGGAVHDLIHRVQERAKLDMSMFEAADKDGSGSIDFDEFAGMPCHAGVSKAKLKKVFERLDADGSGELDAAEFSQYKLAMDREETVGHTIAKELAVTAPDLLQLMLQAGSADKVERAASLSRKKKEDAEHKGDLSSLFEMSATPDAKKNNPLASPSRLPASKSAGGTGASKWKTALHAVRAVQGMKQPSPPPGDAVVAPSPLSASSSGGESGEGARQEGAPQEPGKGKWKKALNAVKAVHEIQSRAQGAEATDSPADGLSSSSGSQTGSQGEGSAPAGKAKWMTALSAVKAANGMQKMSVEHKLEQKPEDHSADFVGLELWDFVCATAELIYVPQKQRELIFTYANPFFNKGMRSGHLNQIGKAIECVFRHMLPFDQYEEQQQKAWEWLWNNLSHTLGHELDVLEKNWNTLVMESWELIQDRADVDSLGKVFWKRLNEIAPDQTHVFRRPLKMWGHLLHHIVNMLIVSISSPDTFFDQLFQLTVRHIRYGVRPHYLPPFGKALMETFEEIVQDEWTEEIHFAWEEVWKRAADSIMRGLNLGGSPLVHALVDGSVERLREAIAEFPRETRSLKLCQIDIEKATVSPLFWALHDGKHDLVNFIMNDLLTIRADLHGYYYGRELLFKHHPDLVGILGRDQPQLLVTLLDGLLWHSKEKTDRKVRVSYYIAELFGRPCEYDDPWNSPLARLCEFADHETFEHPVVCKLLEIKWQIYGLKLFCVQEAWYLQHLVLFMVESNLAEEDCHQGTGRYLRTVLIVLSIFNTVVQFCAWGKQLYDGKVRTVQFWGRQLVMPRTATNLWLWLRVGSWIVLAIVYWVEDCAVMKGFVSPCLALKNGSYAPEGCWVDSASVIFSAKNLTSAVQYAEKEQDGLEWTMLGGVQRDRALLALSGMLLWIQVLECSILSAPMAAFTFSLGIMISDLSHSLFFIGILLLSFGSALSNIGEDPYDEGLDATLATLLQEVLGKGRDNPSTLSSLSVFLQISFIMAVTIIMLNVLIAQLSLTYGKVMNFSRPSMLKYRASVTLDLESLLPHSIRQRIYDSLGFDEPLPLSLSDVGPAGGIQVWEYEADCPGYIPDRIKRYTGDATPQDPWPTHDTES